MRHPVAQPGAGDWQADGLAEALALVWLAHIGLDRLLGMGLKYGDRFTHIPTSATVRTPGSLAAIGRPGG